MILKLFRFGNIIIRSTNVYFIIQGNETCYFAFQTFFSLLTCVKPNTLNHYSSTKCQQYVCRHDIRLQMIFSDSHPYPVIVSFALNFLCDKCFPQVMIREKYIPVSHSLVHLIIFENLKQNVIIEFYFHENRSLIFLKEIQVNSLNLGVQLKICYNFPTPPPFFHQ